MSVSSAGEPVRPEPDHWAGRDSEGLERGRRLYHARSRCLDCHPAYATAAEISTFAAELGAPAPPLRQRPFAPLATESRFGRKLVATDFTRDRLRSVRPQDRMADLYRVVAAGIGGTAMTAGRGEIADPDIWALAHYIDSLAALRGTPGADEQRRRLTAP